MILTPADVTTYAPELDLSQYNTTTISGMLRQAQARAEQFCSVKGFELANESQEELRALISNTGELTVFTRRRPIRSVSAITLRKGGFSTNMVLTQGSTQLYQIPYPYYSVVFPNSYFYMTGTYLAGGSSQLITLKGANVFADITYSAGYDTTQPDDSDTGVPSDLKYAIMLYFRDILAKRNNPAGLQSFSQGSYSESYGSNKEGKSRLILEAEDTLMNGDYVRIELF